MMMTLMGEETLQNSAIEDLETLTNSRRKKIQKEETQIRVRNDDDE